MLHIAEQLFIFNAPAFCSLCLRVSVFVCIHLLYMGLTLYPAFASHVYFALAIVRLCV